MDHHPTRVVCCRIAGSLVHSRKIYQIESATFVVWYLSLTAEDAGYFPIHRQKLEYEELSEQFSPDDMNGKRVLTVALMQRAMESSRERFV